MRYTLAQVLGGKGAGPEQFAAALRGIAIDGRDQLYAAGDSELKTFQDGKLRRRWATAKPGCAVAVAPDGSVYVGQSGQIQIFDPAGRLLDTWHDAGRLGLVTAIGFAAGDVLAADARDRSIRRYDSSGKFLNDIGKNNRTRGFRIPNGALDFSVDAGGVIHAANPGKHRVERYTRDGELLGHFGRFDGRDPSGFSGCCNPTNVAVAGRRVWVTEKAGPRAKAYDFDGKLVSVIAGGFDPTSKNMDIAVDSRGRVYVSDTARLAIAVFEPVEEGAPIS
jgi:sugar lactone lactonase YvrE